MSRVYVLQRLQERTNGDSDVSIEVAQTPEPLVTLVQEEVGIDATWKSWSVSTDVGGRLVMHLGIPSDEDGSTTLYSIFGTETLS